MKKIALNYSKFDLKAIGKTRYRKTTRTKIATFQITFQITCRKMYQLYSLKYWPMLQFRVFAPLPAVVDD